MTPFVSETTVYDDLGKYDIANAAPIHYRYLYNKINEMKEKELIASGKELTKCKKELAAIMKKLSRVRVFISGGDKITLQELVNMEHTFETPIVNGYGNNELTGAAVVSPVYANKPDAVGIPMKGNDVVAFDVSTYEPLMNGMQGEICIQSDSVFLEYLNNTEETNKIKQTHNDGLQWIHTGDLGYVDEDGYVYITGRAKRLIRREAFKIAPETIESAILEMKFVKDCVVVGVSDIQHEGSYVPMAYVELDSDAVDYNSFKSNIMAKCKKDLPDYEIPQYIEIIDKIPYQNTKHDFKKLETMGEEYVKQHVARY